jgi:alpha-galactosidase/6-phospho-beta-glucosidase family protein
MAPKITIVGGGSTHWGPRLLTDFANTPSLHDADVALVDIDEASLPPMMTIAKHIVASRDVAMNVTATTELARGLEGADFVITALSVGGFASMEHDIGVPARYGIFQPVGDSVGPGGISRSLRSIGVVLGIAREVERVAPDALLLNVSNPLTALCRAVTSQTKVRAVGLCNELIGMQFWLSLVFDADMRAIDPVVAGVNHFPLVTSLRIGDQDGFAMLRDALADPQALEGPLWMQPPAQSHWAKIDPGREWGKADILYNNRVKLALFERFGVMPGSADTHVAEFIPWFVQAASDQGRGWGVHHYGIAGHRADKVDDDAWAADLEAGAEVPRWPSGELVAPLIDSVVTGTERHLPVNLPNTGQVIGLPEGAVVECIGTIDGSGVRARDTASPGALTEHLRRVVTSQELTVQATLSEDRGQVLQAMLADPIAGTLPWEHLTAMTDELLARTSAWLPAGLRR